MGALHYWHIKEVKINFIFISGRTRETCSPKVFFDDFAPSIMKVTPQVVWSIYGMYSYYRTLLCAVIIDNCNIIYFV